MTDGVEWHWGRNGTRSKRRYYYKIKGVPCANTYISRIAAQAAYEKELAT